MAYAANPPGGWMSDNARTEGDMKWAFETINVVSWQTAAQPQECWFFYENQGVCRLAPINGRRMTIGGARFDLPPSGLLFVNTALAANTLYLVGVKAGVGIHQVPFTGATTFMLEPDTGTVCVAPGGVIDPNFTLVGMAATDGNRNFSPRVVASWFNRQTQVSQTAHPNMSTSSQTPQTLAATTSVMWPGDLEIRVETGFTSGQQPATALFGIFVDGLAVNQSGSHIGSASAQYVGMHAATRQLKAGYRIIEFRVRVNNWGEIITANTPQMFVIRSG